MPTLNIFSFSYFNRTIFLIIGKAYEKPAIKHTVINSTLYYSGESPHPTRQAGIKYLYTEVVISRNHIKSHPLIHLYTTQLICSKINVK